MAEAARHNLYWHLVLHEQDRVSVASIVQASLEAVFAGDVTDHSGGPARSP